MNVYAGRLYLSLLNAENYSWQEPEYKKAKWYDLFWLLTPIFGPMAFVESIKNR